MTRRALATTLRRGLVAAGLVLMLGGGMAVPAFAQPVKTNLTIGARTRIQTGNCEDGGGSADVTTVKGSVTNGHQVIKTTVSCSGGVLDGETCTNVSGSTSCSQAMVVPTGTPFVPVMVDGAIMNDRSDQSAATPADHTGQIDNIDTSATGMQQPTVAATPTVIDPIPTLLVSDANAAESGEPTATPDAGDGGAVLQVYQVAPIRQAAP